MRLKVSNVCQLLDKSKFRETHVNNGITYTNNGNGTFTVNGTTTSASGSSIYPSDSSANIVKANHKYLMLGFPIAFDGNNYVYFQYYPFNTSIKYYILNNANGYLFFTPADDGNRWNIFYNLKTVGFTINNITVKPQLFDLTEMYGAGNEPTTVAQFRQDFPNEMYEYSPECWKKFRRLKYIANKEPVQLLDKSDFKTVVSKGVTATPNTTNGMWTISGAATASEYLQIGVYYPGTDFNIGDKLFLRHSNIDNSVYFPFAPWYDKDHKYLGEYDGMGVFSVTNPETAYIACYFTTRTVGDINVTTQVQLFNLTRMYGKGNEPTAAEFVAQYPGFDYPVNKYNYLTLNRGKYIANKEPVQLLDKSKYRGSSTVEGITFTNNGDGTWTVVGTAPDDPINHSYVAYSILFFSKEFTQKYLIPGHKIVVGGGKVNYDAFVQWILGWTGGYTASNSSANYTYTITEYPENFGGNYIELRVNKGKTVNFTFKPQFFDLTEMYGAGNEPTTVAQFRADFPNELYDYNPYNAITFR